MDPQVIPVYLESGHKRVFAGAVDWPGWCRGSRDEVSALQALLDYAPRYAHAIKASGLAFVLPETTDVFSIVERLPGNSTTDFGAPAIAPTSDGQPYDEVERQRSQALLEAMWQTFDDVVAATEGKALRKGPRGGGRELDAIVAHVAGADAAYLAGLGYKRQAGDHEHTSPLGPLRNAMKAALAVAAQGQLPEKGPRGGVLWSPRYFLRRVMWHTLDHVWEIEDRVI